MPPNAHPQWSHQETGGSGTLQEHRHLARCREHRHLPRCLEHRHLPRCRERRHLPRCLERRLLPRYRTVTSRYEPANFELDSSKMDVLGTCAVCTPVSDVEPITSNIQSASGTEELPSASSAGESHDQSTDAPGERRGEVPSRRSASGATAGRADT